MTDLSSPGVNAVICYEYPLSERVRTLLRLEDLYRKAWYFTAKAEPVENHVALVLLFDILEVAGRADLKSDLLQELERQRQSLESLRDNPAISVEVLNQVVREIDRTSTSLFQMSGKFGQDLRAEDPSHTFATRDQKDLRFPEGRLGTSYVIALEDFFFVYPTKLREYQQRYKNSFLHGGISPEEMIVPVACLTPRPR